MKLNFSISLGFLILTNLISGISFAQDEDGNSTEDEKMITMENRQSELLERVEFKGPYKESCKKYNHSLFINDASAFYFEDCTLRPLHDSSTLNALILREKKEPLYMTDKVFATLPMGTPYTSDDYEKEFNKEGKNISEFICKKFDNEVVSMDGSTFYYIEGCKKRKFDKYSTANGYNHKNNPVLAISKFELSKFQEGEKILAVRNYSDIRQPTEEEIRLKLPPKEELCKNTNHKIMAFYDSVFYIENCVLFPLKSFPISFQIKIHQNGPIEDLTIEQVLGLKVGAEISSADVLKKKLR